MKKDTDSAYQDAVARGNMYRFLSAIYLQAPTKDLVLNMIDSEFLEDLASLFSGSPLPELNNYAESVDLENDFGAIQQDYMDMFAVPAGRYVTPFEDVYRGTRMDGNQERGPLLGVQAIAVKIMYRIAGAEMDRACKELPTHIGVELAFMNFLCESEAAAINDERATVPPVVETSTESSISIYRELQRRFLQAHLNDWFPQLSQAIQEKATTPFYRALAQVTEEFIARDTTDQEAHYLADKRGHLVQRTAAITQPG